ncbi:MAG: hypothetical protein M1492_08920 [Gammaproteobacteria bacterium]|jgi:hypothetical protein|uniref:hypothetical protein n=1 Tax=Acidithiobacillus ferrooxidans TaxID=920 RepID=UPI002149259B|nr:hypothetical protein [Acidithiobacillus ferrooxidans]MCL4526574.1 hypothetical protein [Gammaproteobacteria bacterium]MCR1345187.1 hypothetical protein [Acidithiobacillus ferrooxidans]MCR1355601.1 hypothetical protein [Acidithiobacillus ferrooxidans]MDA8377380.1 hypothetical protein [Planctomycetia bacterium]
MAFTNLGNGIYDARKMADHPDLHSQEELLKEIDALDSTLITLWSFVGSLGEIMSHTAGEREAWHETHITNIGQGLAAIADLALGIETTADRLLKNRQQKGEIGSGREPHAYN